MIATARTTYQDGRGADGAAPRLRTGAAPTVPRRDDAADDLQARAAAMAARDRASPDALRGAAVAT